MENLKALLSREEAQNKDHGSDQSLDLLVGPWLPGFS